MEESHHACLCGKPMHPWCGQPMYDEAGAEIEGFGAGRICDDCSVKKANRPAQRYITTLGDGGQADPASSGDESAKLTSRRDGSMGRLVISAAKICAALSPSINKAYLCRSAKGSWAMSAVAADTACISKQMVLRIQVCMFVNKTRKEQKSLSNGQSIRFTLAKEA